MIPIAIGFSKENKAGQFPLNVLGKYHRVNSKNQTLNALKNGYNDTEKITKRTINSN